LDSLAKSDVTLHFTTKQSGSNLVLNTLLKNKTDKITFFASLAVVNEKSNQIFPLFWDDNYFSLLPGESRSISCTITKTSLKGQKVFLELSGWNIKTEKLEIK
jgi:exo-1,4-beta-D-glucosaminidase